MKTEKFNGKVFLITGASSGIGKALAIALSKCGARLILSSRNESSLVAVKQECNGNADNIQILPLDLTNHETIAEAAKDSWNKFGSIDYVIHNAGVVVRDFAINTSDEMDRRVMETNYFGPVAITKALLPSMLAAGKGHFVVISSLSGEFGVPLLSSYSASKHALRGFFESLRAEVNEKGIKISIITPGFISTPILENAIDGSGNPFGKNISVIEKGMSAEECAQKILEAIAKEKTEALIGGSEIMSVYFKRFFPKWFSKFIRSHPQKRIQKIKTKTRKIFGLGRTLLLIFLCVVSLLLMMMKQGYSQQLAAPYWRITMIDSSQIVTARFQRMQVDSVQLYTKTKSEKLMQWVLIDSISKIEKIKQHRKNGRGIWIGAVTGGIIGGTIGFLIGHASDEQSQDLFGDFGAIEGTPFGLVIGAIVGGLTGIIVISSRREVSTYPVYVLAPIERRRLISSKCSYN